MGKPKKGKKAQKDDDFGDDDDVQVDLNKLSLADQEEDAPAPTINKKKQKKKAAITVEDDEDDEVPAPQKGGVSAFAMLMDDDDDDMDAASGSDDDQPKQKKASEPTNKKSKKKKNDTKANEEDEDLDAMLAEIEAKPAKKEKKKKKKAKKEEDEDIDAILNELDGNASKEPSEEKTFDLDSFATMTQEEINAHFGEEEDKKSKKKKKKKEKEAAAAKAKEEEKAAEETKSETKSEGDNAEAEEDKEDNEKEEGGAGKTAAQKRKEKKEKQRLKKLQQEPEQEKKSEAEPPAEKKAPAEAEEPKGATAEADSKEKTEGGDEEGDSKQGKKKKDRDRRKKKEEEKEKEKEEKKKKPNKMAKLIQEQQKAIQEAEEKRRLEEEAEERRIEAIRKEKEEKERLKKEKKEKEKQKKKERIERQKAEGTYMTAKEKEAKRRAQLSLEAMKAQGLVIPAADATADAPAEEKKPKRPIYDNRKKKKQAAQRQTSVEEPVSSPVVEVKTPVIEETPEEAPKPEEVEEVKDSWDAPEVEDVKDEWDADTEEEEEEKPAKPAAPQQNGKASAAKVEKPTPAKKQASVTPDDSEEDDEDESESEEESSSEEESESEESSSSDDDDRPASEKARERALARIAKRKADNEKNISTDNLRCPVICVLGHVDTGKTKILDKLRRTNVQDGEAGGITQQIGATNVPREAILEKTKMCKEFTKQELKLPGLLIIDTPGHESFSNLRTRGSSLCDMAILVVDIMHGLEPQTIESINLLKQKKCPFIVALNKVDRLYGWLANPHTDIVNTLKKQKTNTKQEFDERCKEVQVQFAEQGLNTALFHENKNPKEYISMVPTSAHSGDGMGNLVALICELTQSHLAKKLAFTETLQATVMEVKAIQGLGTTIDVILVNGRLREAQTIIVPGTEGPIVTQIRGLLLPEPMKELRVKGQYVHKKEVMAAQGVKIIAKDLDNSLAGLPLHVAYHPDEIPIYEEEVEASLEAVLKSIRVQDKGVFVQASTLGSLEALLQFLKDSKIPFCGINIGPVHRRDVMRATTMLEREPQYAVILAFDVKVERDAQELADREGVQVFTAEIIYHLFDQFMAYRERYKKQKQEQFKHVAVFPCKMRVLPQHIYNSRDPIVCGVVVEAGFVKCGQPICVPSKEFCYLGIVTSLQVNHNNVEKATKGQEVCIKIENVPGETPKLYGRHFEHTDMLMSRISRESIDALKNYFRDEMSNADWKLIMEMKKTFDIL